MIVNIIAGNDSNYYHQIRTNPGHDLPTNNVSDLVAMSLRKLPCPLCFPNQFDKIMDKLKEREDALSLL